MLWEHPEKSIPSRGDKCNGPEAGMCLACLGPRAVWSQGEWPEQVRVGREMGKVCVPCLHTA